MAHTRKYKVNSVKINDKEKLVSIGGKEYAAGDIVELEAEASETWELESRGEIEKVIE